MLHSLVASILLATCVAPSTSPASPASIGGFPQRWINGVSCPNEPEFQIQEYAPGFFILRQSMCVTFEAPFLYLIFGENRALLLDTGAKASSNVASTVHGLIDAWSAQHGHAAFPLVVAHSHAHSDHVQGDAQFAGQPWVEHVVGHSVNEVSSFFGFANWPNDAVTFDLGNRVLDVLAIPGHEASHIALFDRRTRVLLTGDTIYPGHLFVFASSNWPTYVASLKRLVDFAAQHPIEWVLGCHIEMHDTPGALFQYTVVPHPHEHVLQLPSSVIQQAFDGARAMGASPHCQVFADFALHPVFSCGINWFG